MSVRNTANSTSIVDTLPDNYDKLKADDRWILWSFLGDVADNNKQPCWKNYHNTYYPYNSPKIQNRDKSTHLGYVPTHDQLIIDTDETYDPITGEYTEIVHKLWDVTGHSLSEYSTRGEGVNIICNATIDLAYRGEYKDLGIELFTGGNKYIALTGDIVPGTHTIQTLTRDQLLSLYQLIGRKTPSSKRWKSRGINLNAYDLDVIPLNDFCIDSILDAQCDNFALIGRSKLGKTSLLVDMAVSLTTQTPFLNHFKTLKGGSVLFFTGERMGNDFRGVVRDVCRFKGVKSPGDLMQIDGLPTITTNRGLSEFRKECEHNKPKYVVLDPINKAVNKGGNETTLIGHALSQIASMGSEMGFKLLYTDHVSDSKSISGLVQKEDAMYGNTTRDARQWMCLTKLVNKVGSNVINIGIGGNHGVEHDIKCEITFSVKGERTWNVEILSRGQVQLEKARDARELTSREQILLYKREHTKASIRDIVKATGFTYHRVQSELKNA